MKAFIVICIYQRTKTNFNNNTLMTKPKTQQWKQILIFSCSTPAVVYIEQKIGNENINVEFKVMTKNTIFVKQFH